MLHRIFLALNLPENIKEEIRTLQEKLPELPVKWTSPENLHITLVFIGNTSDKELEAMSVLCREIAKKHKPFSFNFSSISYGPSPMQPRMIWLKGEPSKELLKLQKDLEKSLGSSRETAFVPKKLPFKLHLTLGRLNEFEFKNLDLEERPDIQEDISLEIPANSFEIMESELKKGGAEYSIVEKYLLED